MDSQQKVSLALPRWQEAPQEWDDEKIALLKRTIARGASDDELMLFVEQCKRTGLDPFARQIYSIRRKQWNAQARTYEEAQVIQVSIDGFRLIADRTGKYAGQVGPYWCGPDGAWREIWLSDEPPSAAKVGVLRHDFIQPVFSIALYKSYVQVNGHGEPISRWKTDPAGMLGKCFSEDTEILTDQGFQPFPNVTGRVLHVTENGLEPTDAKPFVQRYFGPMIQLNSDDLNFCVTPNHDMVTTNGKIEAVEMYQLARSRPVFRIPRLVRGTGEDADYTDQQIQLAAAYLADGSDVSLSSFKIEVSRLRKIEILTGLALNEGPTYQRISAGISAYTATRTITATADKTGFRYRFAHIKPLVEHGKLINTHELLLLSQRQARLMVDTWVAMDGHKNMKTGVVRIYTSRLDHLEALELLAAKAGYAVSPRRARESDIGTKPNYSITLSSRDTIPVHRWGRRYHNLERKEHNRRHPGLELVSNATGRVWCVTVPSGVIVVRRKGFSMLCGNCAEALALRRAFPNDLSGLYSSEEMGQADNPTQLVMNQLEAPEGAFLNALTDVVTTTNSSRTNESATEQPEAPAVDPGLIPQVENTEAAEALEAELTTMTLEQAKAMPDSRGGTYGAIKPDQLQYRKRNMEGMLGKVDAEKEREYRRKLRAIELITAEARAKNDARTNEINAQLGYPPETPPNKFSKYRKALEQQDAPTAFWLLIKDSKWKPESAKALLEKNGGDFTAAFNDLITRLQQPE